jgi:hypothetical protein
MRDMTKVLGGLVFLRSITIFDSFDLFSEQSYLSTQSSTFFFAKTSTQSAMAKVAKQRHGS